MCVLKMFSSYIENSLMYNNSLMMLDKCGFKYIPILYSIDFIISKILVIT